VLALLAALAVLLGAKQVGAALTFVLNGIDELKPAARVGDHLRLQLGGPALELSSAQKGRVLRGLESCMSLDIACALEPHTLADRI
jgi:hypothetical protein